MRIVDIREAVVPIASDIRNAYIDFSKMTVSVVAHLRLREAGEPVADRRERAGIGGRIGTRRAANR